MSKLVIGAHQSFAKGFLQMGKDALYINSNTFQFFMRNPRGARAKKFDEEDANKLKELMVEYNFGKILCHAPYTLNPCSDKERVRELAYEVMEDDLNRMEFFPNNLYNFHPGSHVGQGVESATEMIVDLLNHTLKEDMTTTVLLETMAGKGTEVGRSFEELRDIIDGVNLKEKMGVCLDTCHIYDGGYDIVNNLDLVLEEFDNIVGLKYLKAIHLNDSKNPFTSHKDRHEKIGQGSLGIETFNNIINHEKLKGIPFYLETPNDLDGYKEEVLLLESLKK